MHSTCIHKHFKAPNFIVFNSLHLQQLNTRAHEIKALNNAKNGWFRGNFLPLKNRFCCYSTNATAIIRIKRSDYRR